MIPDINDYNKFCKSLYEGCILYNIDSTNLWGEFLLVVNITTITLEGKNTYSVLLIGLKKVQEEFVPYNLRVNLTPDYASSVPFLKYIGYCNFNLNPEVSNASVNMGLATVYSEVNLHKYAKKLSIKKPRKRKYGKDGRVVIRNTENE